MRRRSMLRGVALLGGALISPAWLRRAFADASLPPKGEPDPVTGTVLEPITVSEPRRGPANLKRALGRARTTGRPLAVIVIPKAEEDRMVRERALADFILKSRDEQLAPLGAADVVCATLEDIRQTGITVPPTKGEPWFVRIEPDHSARAAMAPYTAQTPQLARAVAALFSLDGKSRDERQALARVAVGLRKARIPGSTWGYMMGCGWGTPAEHGSDDEVDSIGCGMGSAGGESQRFLRFYVAAR